MLTLVAGKRHENLVWTRSSGELVSSPFSGEVSFKSDNRHVAERTRFELEVKGHQNVPNRQATMRGPVPIVEERFPPIVPHPRMSRTDLETDEEP